MAIHVRREARALLAPAVVLALVAGPVLAATSGAAGAGPRPVALDPGLGSTGHRSVKVVVSGRPGAEARVRAATLAAGGSHLRTLPIINGLAASVPADRLASLAAAGGVVAVTADRAVQLTGSSWDDSLSASPYVWTSQAANTWRQTGNTGSGVGIAVLDTGVSDVQDLQGRVMHGPDLSGEGANTVDSFGHGTVMAGIAAGDGAASGSHPRTGVAPGATVVAVKLAGANGASDVSTVLAGLSWVGAFRDTYNIRVLNLSWGVPSTQDPAIDPVNFAVERLWTLGVTVVVAAGNSGPGAGTVMKPGDDPLVITVGAYDDKQDADPGNDTVPAWSSRGPTAQGVAKPDLVAPGRTLVATRAPGSAIETQNPQALVGSAYIKGSGTSEATAVTSGVVALLLQSHPTWTPDQVKYALTSTAVPLGGVAGTLQGAGRLQAKAALNAPVLLAPVQPAVGTGTGPLNGSRGSSAPLQVVCGGVTKVLNDETTSWCSPWSSSAWTSSAWTSSAWTSSAWTSSAWTSSAWTSSAWTSNGYGDEQAASAADGMSGPPTDSGFLTAFYGSHPKYNRRVEGEISLDPSGHMHEQD